MRRIGLLLIAVVYSSLISLNAQYTPLVEEEKYWVYEQFQEAGGGPPSTWSADVVFVSGDTMLNGHNYKKLWKQGLSGTHPCPPDQQPCFQVDIPYERMGNAALVALLREDNEQVFLMPLALANSCEQNEHLIFDFDVQTADSLNNCTRLSIGADSDPQFGMVDSISDELIYDVLRETHFTQGFISYEGLPANEVIKIAEGVGYERQGILFTSGANTRMIDFCEGSWEDCNFIISNIPSKPEKAITFYPNPTDGILFNKGAFYNRLTLHDVYGRYIRKLNAEVNNLTDLPVGTYFIRIIEDNQLIETKKIIIY